jgi:CubicO group peptidase (beta-lactamase class C family)
MISEHYNLPIHIGQTDVTPEEVGYNPSRLEIFDAFLLNLVQKNKLQCAGYLLSRNGKVIAKKSMGKLSGVEDQGDYMPDSIRRVASITKAFTAVAIMKLLEEGKLYLDQPIHTILTEIDDTMHCTITIFHLLTHTSGVVADPGYFSEPYMRGWWDSPQDQPWIHRILLGPMQSKPGEAWTYSSSGFTLLGEIISRVSGVDYEEYIRQAIIEPLGLTKTFFEVPEHLHNEVCVVNEWDEKRLKSTEPRTGLPPRSGGGLYSSMQDLWAFGQMLLNNGELNGKRIIGRKTAEAMTRNHLFGVPSYYWGSNLKDKGYTLGLTVHNDPWEMVSSGTYSHGGAGRCELLVDPIEQAILVLIVPSTIGWVPESVNNPRNILWSGLE